MERNSQEIDDYIKANIRDMTYREIGDELGMTDEAIRSRCKKLNTRRGQVMTEGKSISEIIEYDKSKRYKTKERSATDKKLNVLLERVDELERELEASYLIKEKVNPYKFLYKETKTKGESVAVAIASDWHIEEEVRPETINGLNIYTLELAKQRAEQFFRNTLKLVKKEQNETTIDTLVLALLGDFITGNIHEELLETCSLRPMEAIIVAENLIIGGIDYLLENSELKLIIPCAVGNHSRITKTTHIGTERGNSIETFMYHHLKNYYKNNKRVEFQIAEGYLSYLRIWDFTICFQHGHAVRYGGGIGGLTIPMNKAIAQWEKIKKADLYVLGHWHTFFDGGNFIVNGSMIGYNPFALFIKANFERPKQTFFLINKKYNAKTVVIPIMFND